MLDPKGPTPHRYVEFVLVEECHKLEATGYNRADVVKVEGCRLYQQMACQRARMSMGGGARQTAITAPW